MTNNSDDNSTMDMLSLSRVDRKRYTRMVESDDMLLLTEINAIQLWTFPIQYVGWEEVARRLASKSPIKKDPAACRGRFNYMLRRLRAAIADAKRNSVDFQPSGPRDALLLEIFKKLEQGDATMREMGEERGKEGDQSIRTRRGRKRRSFLDDSELRQDDGEGNDEEIEHDEPEQQENDGTTIDITPIVDVVGESKRHKTNHELSASSDATPRERVDVIDMDEPNRREWWFKEQELEIRRQELQLRRQELAQQQEQLHLHRELMQKMFELMSQVIQKNSSHM